MSIGVPDEEKDLILESILDSEYENTPSYKLSLRALMTREVFSFFFIKNLGHNFFD